MNTKNLVYVFLVSTLAFDMASGAVHVSVETKLTANQFPGLSEDSKSLVNFEDEASGPEDSKPVVAFYAKNGRKTVPLYRDSQSLNCLELQQKVSSVNQELAKTRYQDMNLIPVEKGDISKFTVAPPKTFPEPERNASKIIFEESTGKVALIGKGYSNKEFKIKETQVTKMSLSCEGETHQIIPQVKRVWIDAGKLKNILLIEKSVSGARDDCTDHTAYQVVW